MKNALKFPVLIISLNLLGILIGGFDGTAAGQNPSLYRLAGKVTRTDGTAAGGEIVYLFWYKDGKCDYRLERASERWENLSKESAGQDGRGRTVRS